MNVKSLPHAVLNVNMDPLGPAEKIGELVLEVIKFHELSFRIGAWSEIFISDQSVDEKLQFSRRVVGENYFRLGKTENSR